MAWSPVLSSDEGRGRKETRSRGTQFPDAIRDIEKAENLEVRKLSAGQQARPDERRALEEEREKLRARLDRGFGTLGLEQNFVEKTAEHRAKVQHDTARLATVEDRLCELLYPDPLRCRHEQAIWREQREELAKERDKKLEAAVRKLWEVRQQQLREGTIPKPPPPASPPRTRSKGHKPLRSAPGRNLGVKQWQVPTLLGVRG